MAEALETLGRTDEAAGAADVHLPLLAHGFRSADGAMIGIDEGRAVLVARQIFHHLRDDVAGALDDDAVAGPDAKAGNLIGIVQRDVGDDDPANRDGSEPPYRGQFAGAADLDVNRLQRSLRTLGGEFVRDGPARRLRDETQPLLPVEAVDLVHHAINVEGQIGAAPFDVSIMGEYGVERFDAHQHIRHRHAPARDSLHDAKLRVGGQRAVRTPAMGEEAQRAGGGDGSILLAQRTRCGVAGVGELARLFGVFGVGEQALVQGHEIALGHIDLPANLEQVGDIGAGKALGNIADGADIGGDVLASCPVSTRRGQHQFALLVAQRAGQAVDLRLGSDRHRRIV